jgi:hypothetical protein
VSTLYCVTFRQVTVIVSCALCSFERERFTNPTDAGVQQRRDELLTEAAVRSPGFGGLILPHLLQPVQKNRYTARQIVEAFARLDDPLADSLPLVPETAQVCARVVTVSVFSCFLFHGCCIFWGRCLLRSLSTSTTQGTTTT